MSLINLDAFPQTRQVSLVCSAEKSRVRSDKFWWFCKVNTRFPFCFLIFRWCVSEQNFLRSSLWCCVSISSMPHSHPWSGFNFLGYSFFFFFFPTPSLVLTPAVPAPAHLIKNSVCCKARTVQPSSTKHSDLAHSIMQNSSEEKPSGKCRSRFFHDDKKKRSLQGMFRCVGGGKLFKKKKKQFVKGFHDVSDLGQASEG